MKFTPQELYTPLTKKWEHYIELFNNHKITLEQFSKAINIDNEQRADADTWEMFHDQICYAMTQLHPPLYIDGYTVHDLLVDDTGTLISCQLDTYGDKSEFTFLQSCFTESPGDMVDFLLTTFVTVCDSDAISEKHCEYLCKKTVDSTCKYLSSNHILALLETINEYVFMRRMMVEHKNLPKFKKFVFEPIEKHYYQTQAPDSVTADDIKDLFDI